jgi:hypothetical protein
MEDPMRSILFFTLLILIAFIPVLTIAGPDGVPDEVVTMEISGMS